MNAKFIGAGGGAAGAAAVIAALPAGWANNSSGFGERDGRGGSGRGPLDRGADVVSAGNAGECVLGGAVGITGNRAP